MRDTTTTQPGAAKKPPPMPLRERMAEWAQGMWRPAGTAVAVVLILLFGWGVVNGKHGLSAWEQQRVKDTQLKSEIQRLQQENGELRDHVERLKSDPDAIEHEARQQLHYAKPGDVIYALPAQPESQPAITAR
ncbi:MAG: septum formation initiator family protein [Terracidiphilus sp.]